MSGTRYVMTAENDSSDPPGTIHLVYGAESGWRFMAQHGSRDYPVMPEGIAFLAHVLREHGYRVRPAGATRPTVTVLCGSTRFYDAFQEANYRLTMEGHIVLSVGFYPHARAQHGHGEGVGHDSADKIRLDELHKRKIDLADEVLVLNVGGYIGESTRSEIVYARAIGVPVSFLEPINA